MPATEQKSDVQTMDDTSQFLVVDDSQAFRTTMRTFIRKFYPDSVCDEHDPEDKADAADDLDWSQYDVLFLDYNLGSYGSGLDWYKQHKKNSNFPATIMLTGTGNERVAVRAIKSGIHEYLPKEALSKKRLSASIKSAMQARSDEIEKAMSLSHFGTTFNKSLFYNRLDKISSHNKGSKSSTLLLVLLDAHKIIGETWGLLARDNLVRHITKQAYQYLIEFFPDLNIVRYGDYYVGILIGEPASELKLEDTLSGLCKQYQDVNYQDGTSDIKFSVSIGAIPLNDINMKSGEIISLAQEVCQKGQDIADSSFVIHIPEKKEKATKDDRGAATEKFDADAAIKEDRIAPRFQQIVSLADETEQTEDELYDIRVRFLEADGNILEGNEFKDMIQDTDVLQSVDKWVLRMAVGKLLRLEDSSETKVKYAVKLTGPSLANPEFMLWVMELLKKDKFRETSLLIEISVDDFLKYTKPVCGLMSYMRNVYNFSFILSALDDLDTFNLIFNQEKFEYIKLDVKLTQGLLEVGEASDKIDSIVNKAHETGVKVIATWIEDTSAIYTAHTKNIDLIQGYFVSPPQDDIEYIE